MRLNELKDNEGARYKFKRVGRGLGSGKGKTAGRGYKGQKARTGVAIKGFEGGQTPLHVRLPKRGFRSLNRIETQVLNLHNIEAAIEQGKLKAGTTITKEVLYAAGLINKLYLPVKLLGRGEVTSKINIEIDAASKSAVEAISAKGGTVATKAA